MLNKEEEYQSLKSKYKKCTICHYYWRQRCFFTNCKQAHGIDDLKRFPLEHFTQLKEQFFTLKAERHPPLEPKDYENQYQKSIDYLLYSSDEEEYREKKPLKYSQMTKDQLKNRESFRKEEMCKFMEILFKEEMAVTGNGYIHRSRGEKEFANAHIKCDFTLFMDRGIGFSKKIANPDGTKTEIFVKCVPMTADEYYGIMSNRVVSVLNNHPELMDKIPISFEVELRPIYYEEVPATEMPFHQILRILNITNLEGLIQRFNADENIKEVFRNSEHVEERKDMEVPENIFKVNEESELILISEEFIKNRFKGSNILYPLKIRCKLIKEGIFGERRAKIGRRAIIQTAIHNLGYRGFLFPNMDMHLKIKGVPRPEDLISLTGKCPINHISRTTPHDYQEMCLKLLQFKRKETEICGDEGEVNNIYKIKDYIILVNSSHTFKYAVQSLRTCKEASIDLEGFLRIKGSIDTIQIAHATQVFIFDIFILIKRNKLYRRVHHFLQLFFANPDILKVFFACQRDSEALHAHLSTCPQNIFDLQAGHIFLNQLKELENNKSKKSISKMGSMPSLNNTLKHFGGEINQFKTEMKKVFQSGHGSYEIRPLSIDFIEYAAQDVKDLAMVKNIIVNQVSEYMHPYYAWHLLQIASLAYSSINCKLFRDKYKLMQTILLNSS